MSFTDNEDEPLVFAKSTLGSVLDVEFEEDFNEFKLPQKLIDNIQSDKRRWLVLLTFCYAAWINSVLWITFAPISLSVASYYNTTPFWVNFLSLLFFVIYVPGAFVASWVLDHLGLRVGIIMGTSLLFFGSLIRLTGAFPDGFIIVCIGQAICACGQPFIQNSPAKVAAFWFPDDQRALATTLGSVSNPIGGALGLLVPPVVYGITGSIPILLLVDCILALIALLLILIFFKKRPRHPPSMTALKQEYKDKYKKNANREFKEAIVFLFKDRSYIILFLIYSLNVGAFQALATLVSQLTTPFGYTDGQSGFMGALVVAAGVVSAGIIAKIMDRHRVYTLVLFMCLAFTWYWNLLWTSVLLPDNYILLLITAALYGSALLPVLPICVALASEVTYPISEATPIGFMVMGGMIWSAVLIFAMSAIIAYINIHWACYLIGIQSGMGYIFLWFFKGELKRSNAEKEHQEESLLK